MSPLEINLDQILAPYRNQGALSQNLASNTRQQLSEQIVQILLAHFQTISQKHNVLKYYRKWVTWCHPDKGDITTDFDFESEPVISAKLANEINSLSTVNQGAASSNTGAFFQLLNKAYDAFANPGNKKTDEVHDALSFSSWLQQFMNNPQFYTVVNQNLQLRAWSQIIYVEAGPNQYFAGELGEWIQYNLHKQLFQVLTHAADKQSVYDELYDFLSNGEYDKLFADLINPHSDSHFIDNLFDTVYPPNSDLKAPDPLALLSPDEAIIQYHLKIAQEELHKPYHQNGRKIEIAIRGWVNHAGQPLTHLTTLAGKRRYDQAQLYLSLWHILYADPTAQDNFQHLGRAEITTLASRSHTEKQYATLRTLFSDLNNQTTIDLNQTVYPQGNWNWLLEATDWLYAHGHDAAIARPWVLHQSKNNIYEEDYFDAKGEKRINRVLSNIKKATQNFTLTKLLGKPEYALFLPFLFFALLSCLTSPLSEVYIGLLLPIASILTLKAVSFCHGVLESALQNLAQTNQPFSLAVPLWVPSILKEYYGQVVAPLWRIISQPYDDFYTSLQAKQRLRYSYPLRVFLGTTLALLTSISFIADQLALHFNRVLGIAIIGLFNLPFAITNAILHTPSFLRNLKFSRSNAAAPTQPSSVPTPAPDFGLSKQPILLICGPVAKTVPAISAPVESLAQKEMASLKPT